MKLILASSLDPAAENIATKLLELYGFEKSPAPPNTYVLGSVMLAFVNMEVTQITTLPVGASEVIVASRHASESGRPTLTVHAPGDPKSLELAKASPPTIKMAVKTLERMRGELRLNYEVTLEATHHGPVKLDVPITFVEIGSTHEQWSDEGAGEAVARAIMAAATSPAECHRAVGLGGPHYAYRHTEVVLHSDVGIGHILPKYVDIDQRLIERAVARTEGGVELLMLDWKGMSVEQRRLSRQTASQLGVRVVRTGEILGKSFKSARGEG